MKLYPFPIPCAFEVEVEGGVIDRDAVKHNIKVLEIAAAALGLGWGAHVHGTRPSTV